ncbi:ABC transporter permease subunit [Alteromonas sp. KUL49]|nr:ABC transporter permease subunit [Alteromonas sp. KUL49]
MTSDNDNRQVQRQRKDKWAGYIVTAFGGLVLLTLVLLITHLLSQAIPLTFVPSMKKQYEITLPEDARLLSVGDLSGGQPVVIQTTPCRLGLYAVEQSHSLVLQHDYIQPCDHAFATVSLMGESYIVDISQSGLVRITSVRDLAFTSSSNQMVSAAGLSPMFNEGMSFSLPTDVWESKTSWSFDLSKQWAVATINTPYKRFVRWVNRANPTQFIDQEFELSSNVRVLAGANVMLVESEQEHYIVDLQGREVELTDLGDVISIDKLEKNRTFFAYDSDGKVTRWVLVNDRGTLTFRSTYSFQLPSSSRVIALREHGSANAVFILTDDNRLSIINRITGEQVSETQVPQDLLDIRVFGNRLYGVSGHSLSVWGIENISGVTTWASLFEPQFYEGYGSTEFVWQTTSASDFQEAKFSLTPLLIGSIKASLLALIIAIPMAVGAAIYTAFFAKSRLRHVIKPAIEMLEAVPSVLIGFIAAIWLSPKADQFLFSFAFFLVTVPFILIVVAIFQRRVAAYLPSKIRHGAELGFAIGGIFVVTYISIQWAPALLFDVIGFDGFAALAEQSETAVGKTTIVVAIALGIAISPSIYSLAEDAINGVPEELKHASFALGATRLQTLMHVVLRVAMPGILAAIMLGFGRAFGETMIVLMVTGNTPIASWGLIEGLRALTANLAIELPEADVGAAHYQILFFTACILFSFTFVVNTFAELLRQRIKVRG